LLDEALKALKTINAKDFVEMKSLASPPTLIKLTFEATCIMLGVKPAKPSNAAVKNLKKGETLPPDYWEPSRKLLSDYKKLMYNLVDYDKDNIPVERISKIQAYLNDPRFTPENIKKASIAAEGICKWVIAICKYDIIAKEISPKREALAIA
jgi:dynein heavy chain